MSHFTPRAVVLGLTSLLLAAPVFAQPSTQEAETAAKIDCSMFKQSSDGSWKDMSGKIYKADGSKAEAGMAVALDQKCSSKSK